MEPKEKAEELVNQFYYKCEFKYEDWHQAKQCALIAADEILDEVNSVSALAYWQEVKQEIEKL